MTIEILSLKKLFDGKHIGKTCFICKGKGHHLSENQYAKLLADCKTKGKINWKKVEKSIDDGGMRCEVCHGEKRLYYSFIFHQRNLVKVD